LQPLDFAVLGTGDRLGAGQPGQRLVAVARKQQALQVVAEAATLRQAGELDVEPLGVGLQWARRGWARTSSGHRTGRLLAADRTMDRTAEAYPNLNELPLMGAMPKWREGVSDQRKRVMP
jgi:hypothetical protein